MKTLFIGHVLYFPYIYWKIRIVFSHTIKSHMTSLPYIAAQTTRVEIWADNDMSHSENHNMLVICVMYNNLCYKYNI